MLSLCFILLLMVYIMNVLKSGLTVVSVLGFVGCASVGGVAKLHVNNQKAEGVIYGLGSDARNIKEVCDAIDNKDPRCLEQDKYQSVFVCSKFGFADAGVGIIALAPKNMDIGENGITGNNSKNTYLKAKVEKGRLGTVLEVASRPGDGKCHWGGLPRAGGTVCPAYNYDYRKDFIGIPR